MIQLLFDLAMLACTGGLIGWGVYLQRELNQLQRRQVSGPSDAELDHVRRLEIAAGLREPDPTTGKPDRPEAIMCPCKHLINMHRPGKRGRCTVAVSKDGLHGCACEWGQEDIMEWYKGTGAWRR